MGLRRERREKTAVVKVDISVCLDLQEEHLIRIGSCEIILVH